MKRGHYNKQVKTTILLDNRRAYKDGKFPVKLRVTYNYKQKYYPTEYSLTEKEWKSVQGDKPREDKKAIKLSLNDFERRAIDIIKTLPSFTFEAFEKQFKENHDRATKDVFSIYEEYIKTLSNEGRAGTASSYNCSLTSLKLFHNRKALPFEQVTLEFLKSYEHWMISKGKSLTTVGIYLRPLRTICNIGIESGLLPADAYPFGKRRYQIPAGRNVKKALTVKDIQKILTYKPQSNHLPEGRRALQNERALKARDFFIFSYLCNGANIKDILRLKYRNIEDDKITFIRSKTERTSKKNLKSVVAILTPEVKEIIQRWGNPNQQPDNFIFDVLTENLTPERERALIQQTTKNINKHIRRIATEVGIEKEVTTYTARHSYASALYRAGVSVSFISDSLGHHDIRTTNSYLDNFEDDVRKQHASILTNF